jgi:lipoic acid synthetase/lipoate-protein ligase A
MAYMNNLLIHLPSGKRLVWYLAAEEYFAKNIHLLNQTYTKGKQNADDNPNAFDGILFTWIVSPTVIFGRHQVMENEVNVDFCHQNNIAMYRRKSGGGCVYADEGNLMISYISPSTHSEQVFQSYLDQMSNTLSQLGYNAVKSSHNDIMIGEHKVSGNACFALPQATIVHGTLLYNVNFEILQQAITPSREKLAKHGVQSVRQRVMNLKDIYIANNIAINSTLHLSQIIESIWCNTSYELTYSDLAAINAIEQEYLDPAFISRL